MSLFCNLRQSKTKYPGSLGSWVLGLISYEEMRTQTKNISTVVSLLFRSKNYSDFYIGPRPGCRLHVGKLILQTLSDVSSAGMFCYNYCLTLYIEYTGKTYKNVPG